MDILARQVASPVEWTAQLERMYESGARVFVECGPKRALTGFSAAVFKGRPHRALATNLPKRGETMAFLDALAGLFAMGFPVTALPAATADLFGADAPRRATTEAQASRTVARARERAALPEATVARLVALDEVLGTSDPADLALLVEDLTTDPEARARVAARLAEVGRSLSLIHI